MITLLLWRCPQCRTDDTMRAAKRLLGPATVQCTACGTRWLVRRVPGHDYRLRVIAGEAALIGAELPLAEWYARLKAGLGLRARPAGPLALEPGEEAYTCDEDVALIVRRGTPLPPLGQDRHAPAAWPPRQPRPEAWETVGRGRLCLTNRRLLWQAPSGGYDFHWPAVRAVFGFLTVHMGIIYGDVAYRFQPPKGTLLKWLTYSRLLAEHLKEATGQSIAVPYY